MPALAVARVGKAELLASFILSALQNVDNATRNGVEAFYSFCIGNIGHRTPLLAFVLLAFMLVRVHLKRHIPPSAIPHAPAPRQFDELYGWLLRAVLLGVVFFVDEASLAFLKRIHAKKIAAVHEYYPNALAGFVFALPKLLSFLMGRLVAVRVCSHLESLFINVADLSFEMTLRQYLCWLFGFYLIRRLFRNTWLYVKQVNLSDNSTYVLVFCFYLIYIYDKFPTAQLLDLIRAIRDAVEPYCYGGAYGVSILLILLFTLRPGILQGVWHLMRFDFQYAAAYAVVWDFYGFGSWGTIKPLLDAGANLEAHSFFPPFLIYAILHLCSQHVLLGAFMNFVFLFVLKFGEFMTYTAI
jgi:hypothetical protein